MTFTNIRPQLVRHDETGATVGSVDRYTIEYALGGRSLRIPVDRGVGTYYFIIPAQPRWNDGTPLTESEVATAIDIIRAAYQRSGISSEFERADPS